MARRYLFGPVNAEFMHNFLGRPRREGECLVFNSYGNADVTSAPDDSWEKVQARLPEGWRPDFLVVHLAYSTIPAWVWSAPVPLIGFAPDANLLCHHYRRALPRCDLFLADAPTVAAFACAGLTHGRPANLFGLSQDFPTPTMPEGPRDIDVLFVGSLQAATQRRRLRWLGRLARLSNRWRVAIGSGIFGADYRKLLAASRVVFNFSIRGECNQRAFEAASGGALLFQERGNAEIQEYFRDRQECVLYGDEEELETLLSYYLEREDERRALALAGWKRARHYTFDKLWTRILRGLEEGWPALVEAASRRPTPGREEGLLARTLQALGAGDAGDPLLSADLTAASAEQPGAAALHNAIGLVATRAAQGSGGVSSLHAEAAAGHFRQAVATDPGHLLARLNLVETLAVLPKHKEEAVRQALDTLTLLERLPPRWAEDGRLPGWLDEGHFPPSFDLFRVEWERAAFDHAGRPATEAGAKRDLLRWRLHALLAVLTGHVQHHYEAVLARPDLSITQAALGSALLCSGQPVAAVAHLRRATAGDPWHRGAARALFDALGAAGDTDGRRRAARDQRLLLRAAPGTVKAEDWFVNTPPVGDELVSLVILCCNELEVTRLCLESVLRHTRRPYELVLIDNACADATPAYLEEIHKRPGPARVVVVRNDANRGFPAGCNQGSAHSRGDYVVFLNNDTVVTEGWLEGLIGWAVFDWPHVGLVGAVTNYSREPQQIAVDYKDVSDLDAFAARRRQAFAGKALEVERLTGFCLLARRELLQRIGGFDERYGAGFFDDDDLCVRARQAGFRLLLALNVFIHHFGSRTFTGLKIDCRKQLQGNFAQFREKWGPEHAAGYRLPEPATTADDPVFASAVLPVAASERPRVSLCMIVKNEEANLPACLQSVADLFDEVIVLDTGSTDRTREIAAKMGARVFEFAWCDSFSAARNESQRHATGHWIMWMDADDRLDEENRAKLRALFAGLKAENLAYTLKCRCLPDPGGLETLVDHVRLFRNHPQIRWEHRVHEQILGAVRRQGGAVRVVDIEVRHTGYQDRALRRRKLERDLRLLLLEEKEQPEHPFTLFNLGQVYQELERHREALSCLERSLKASHPEASIVRKLYALIVQAHRRLGQPLEALGVCRDGRELYPDDAELLFMEGLVREERDELPAAEACLLRLLQTDERPDFASIAAGLRGFKARHLLGRVYHKQGKLAAAEAQVRAALQEQPNYLPAWLELGDMLLHQQRWEELEQLVRRLEGEPRTHAEGVLVRARAHLARKELAPARLLLESLIARLPQAVGPWRFLSYVCLQAGDWERARKALQTVLGLDPHDLEAARNLEILVREHGAG